VCAWAHVTCCSRSSQEVLRAQLCSTRQSRRTCALPDTAATVSRCTLSAPLSGVLSRLSSHRRADARRPGAAAAAGQRAGAQGASQQICPGAADDGGGCSAGGRARAAGGSAGGCCGSGVGGRRGACGCRGARRCQTARPWRRRCSGCKGVEEGRGGCGRCCAGGGHCAACCTEAEEEEDWQQEEAAAPKDGGSVAWVSPAVSRTLGNPIWCRPLTQGCGRCTRFSRVCCLTCRACSRL
jgi:hypothetical protein